MATFSRENFSLGESSKPDLKATVDQIERDKAKKIKEIEKSSGELFAAEAFDTLKAIKLSEGEAARNGQDADPNALARQFSQAAREGKLTTVVETLEQIEADRLAEEKSDVIRTDIEQAVQEGDTSEENLERIRQTGFLGISTQDPFFHDAKAAHQNATRRKQLEFGRISLEALAQGYSKETIERAELTRPDTPEAFQQSIEGEAIEPGSQFGLGVPLLSPVDLVVDVFTGALLAKGIKVAGKELIKKGGDSLLKAVGREAFYGQIAGGFMALADLSGAGPVLEFMSGIIGTQATASLALMSRKSLGTMMSRLRAGNPEIYREIKTGVKGREDKFSATLNETIDAIEKGEIVLPTEKADLPQSPVASTVDTAVAAGDEGAVKSVQETMLVAAGNPEQEVGQIAAKAAGTGSATGMSIFPVQSDLGDVVAGTTGKTLDNRSDLSEFIHNANKISEGTARHLMHDVLASSNSPVPGIVEASIYKNKGVYVGGLAEAASNSFKTGKIGTGTKVLHPTRFLKDLALAAVDIPTLNERDARQITKNAEEIIKGVFSGVTKEESSELQNLFRVATDLNEPMVPVRGGLAPASNLDKVYPATDKLIRKFAEGRMVMDSLWESANSAQLQTWRNKGLKQLDNQFIAEPKSNVKNGTVDVDGNVWSKELKDNGYTPVRLINTQDPDSKRIAYKFLSPDETDTRLTDISDDIQAIPFRESYMPIRIAEETGSHQVVRAEFNPKTQEWKLNRVAAGATKKEVNETISELNRLDARAKYFSVRNDESANINDLTLDKGLSDIFRTMTKKDIEAFKNALRADPNISKEEASSILGYIETYNYQKIQPLRRRGKERLRRAEEVTKNLQDKSETKIVEAIQKELAGEEPFMPTDRAKIIQEAILDAPEAPLEPTEAAMANYAEVMSRFISHSDWNAKLQDDFVNRFSDVLDHPRWSANISADGKLIDTKGNRRPWNDAERQKVKEAQVVQHQLRKAFNLPSQQKRDAQIFWKNAADKFYGRDIPLVGKAIDKYLKDGIRIGGAALSRQLGATTKLGLFAWSQLVVQPTVALNAFKYAATDPTALVQGMRDFHGAYTRAMIGGRLGLPVKETDKNLLDIIEHSGINTGIDFDYAQRVMNNVGGWSKRKLPSRVGAGVVKAGFLPLQVGESAGRGIIFFTERQALINKIKRGEHPRFKEKDIDSDAFIAEVKLSTQTTAGNFSKFNQAWIAEEGWRSAILQFSSYPLFQAEFMMGGGLSKTQRAAVWGAWIAMFGKEGIPFINDIEFAGEHAAAYATGDPSFIGSTDRWTYQAAKNVAEKFTGGKVPTEVSDFAQRIVNAGSVTALSEGELNWARRAGLGEFTRRFIDGLSVEDLLGVGISSTAKLLDDSVKSTRDLIDLWQKGEFNPEGVLRELQEGTRQLSGITNMIGATRPQLYDSRNRIQIDDPTTGQRVQRFVGLTPGEAVSLSEREWNARQQSNVWKGWMFDEAFSIINMSRESPKTAVARFNERMKFLANKNPQLAFKFMDITLHLWSDRDLPADMRTKMLEYKKGITPMNNFFTE